MWCRSLYHRDPISLTRARGEKWRGPTEGALGSTHRLVELGRPASRMRGVGPLRYRVLEACAVCPLLIWEPSVRISPRIASLSGPFWVGLRFATPLRPHLMGAPTFPSLFQLSRCPPEPQAQLDPEKIFCSGPLPLRDFKEGWEGDCPDRDSLGGVGPC